MMLRPVLLATLVVCSLGVSVVAVQPAAGDGLSETTILDDSDDSEQNSTDDQTSEDSDGAESTPDDERNDDEEDDDGWYDRWESKRSNRSDNRTTGDDGANRTADGNESGANRTAGDEENSSAASDDGDGSDGPDGYGDERDGDANGSDREADRGNWSHVVPERVISGETVEWVTEGPAGEVADVYRGPGSDALSEGVLDIEDSDHPDAREDSSEPVSPQVDDRNDRDDPDDRTHDGTAAPADPDGPAGAESAEQTDPGTSDPGDDGGGEGEGEVPEPPSGAGAGVALFVTVGYLGGTRAAVTQANLVVATAPEESLRSFHATVNEYLPDRPDVVAPAVFGYSRHDSSDPLENDTRAAIYEQVRESPGIYHARLAEETDVAVETVRYHCRILAEEGLVEPRKHRGKRRLYPVSMEEDDPQLGAAMADSAAADVLSAIERLEPATISAVAEHVGCAPSTVTYHLDRLEEDGLVTRERDGGAVEVRLRRDARSALQTSVADD